MKQSVTAYWRRLVGGAGRVTAPLKNLRARWRLCVGVVAVIGLALFILGSWWSAAPTPLAVRAYANDRAAILEGSQAADIPGFMVTATLVHTATTLLEKPGGLIRNDRLPPGVWLDNMPNWEVGVLWHIRDTLQVLRQDISRGSAQAEENPDLVVADPQWNFTSTRWLFPSPENEYQRGLLHLERYLNSLAADEAEFNVRAQDLVTLLQQAEERLRIAGEQLRSSSPAVTYAPDHLVQLNNSEAVAPVTRRLAVDDVFYQSRGYTWALLHTLQAVALEYEAQIPPAGRAELDAAIAELAAMQRPVWSPLILNGNGFGLLTNHSRIAAAHVMQARQKLEALRLIVAAE